MSRKKARSTTRTRCPTCRRRKSSPPRRWRSSRCSARCRTSSARYYESDRPIELRPVELGRYFGQKIDDGRINVWIRTASKLPDDPALHMCALAYASDFSLLDAAMARYGRTLFDKRMMPASLDHAMWFHRPFRADEWLLYAQDSPSARGGRGLTRGMIFKQDGTLVASVAQEGSLRERK